MRMLHGLIVLLAFQTTLHASVLYQVTLDTTPLIGKTAGPFWLSFQLSDGSGTGDGNNAATLSHFVFDGGSEAGPPITVGSVFGDLSTEVLLTDAALPSFFAQPFLPGSLLHFELALTTNVDAGPIADAFTFSVLDSTLTPLPTTAGPFLDVLAEIDIDSAMPAVSTFSGDGTRSPAAGGPPIPLAAPSVQVATPEPTTLVLMGGAFLILRCLAGIRRQKR